MTQLHLLLFKDVIASASLSGGYIRGWGNDAVAINDRYFKGNFEFRGFDNAGVGPRVVSFLTQDEGEEVVEIRERALGGNAFALANAEVSFPLGIASLLGSVFLEAGTVGLLDETDQFNRIRGFTPDGPSDLFTVGSSCEGITMETKAKSLQAQVKSKGSVEAVRADSALKAQAQSLQVDQQKLQVEEYYTAQELKISRLDFEHRTGLFLIRCFFLYAQPCFALKKCYD